MKTTLAVYVNTDDALLLWTADRLDAALTGFAIQRRLTRSGRRGKATWLDNYAPPGKERHRSGRHQSSDEWPFRRFSWTDHEVGPGDTVSYRVVPVLAGAAAPSENLASRWSPRRTLGAAGGSRYEASFNRGFVISQFMSRYLDDHFPGMSRSKALREFKQDIGDQLEDRLRVFLSGHLRTTMLRLLDEVDRGRGEVYAALFELIDEQLLRALEAFGPRAHVVLANGSVQVKTGPDNKAVETSAQARTRDENEKARARLLARGVDVEAGNRFVSPGALAHNKFLVVTTPAGEATRVWTGSMNWTPTGLCTQLNNGLLVDDADVAEAYLAQWRALRAAGSTHPKALVASNGRPATAGDDRPGAVRASVHFTRAGKRVDLTALGEIVSGAKEGVLFLMFIPGGSGTLADVRKLAAAKPNLLVRGVVSDLPKGREDEHTGRRTTVRVTLFGAPEETRPTTQTYDVVQPEGMAHPAAWWAVETTRSQFKNNVGHAIIHSKVLVVDPFSDDPTVVTGSHNFSISASEKNDENFIVVRGDRALAEAYAVHIESAWRHYAARAGQVHPKLGGVDYLNALLTDQRREEKFWRL